VKIVIIIVAIVFVLLAIFTAANWHTLTTSTPLSFVAFSVEGPLGIILLVVSLILTLLVVAYALLLRTSWLIESRRLNRQLEEQRELAQQAETSRFIALQELIESEFKNLRTHVTESGISTIARAEQTEQILLKSIEEAANGISAHLGYIDDKLKNDTRT